MKIFFSAGEPSGDLHGANLIRQLRARRPDIECVGYGGPLMAAAGCELHADLTALAVMFLLRALLHLPKFLALAQPGRSLFSPSSARRRGAHRLSGIQLVDCAAGQGAWHSGVLFRAAADLGLGRNIA